MAVMMSFNYSRYFRGTYRPSFPLFTFVVIAIGFFTVPRAESFNQKTILGIRQHDPRRIHGVGTTISQQPGSSRSIRAVRQRQNTQRRYNDASELFADPINSASVSEVASQKQRSAVLSESPANVWEELASKFVKLPQSNDPTQLKKYVEALSLIRVGIPALGAAILANLVYPSVAMELAYAIDDSGVFAVVAQDASQYIQNICTTSGLVFSLLVGQT